MSLGLIAKRYATALHEFSLLKGEHQRIYNEAVWLTTTLKEHPEVREIVNSPIIEKSFKLSILTRLPSDGFSSQMARFLRLIVEHERESMILFILHSYQRIYKKHFGIRDVKLQSAYELNEELCEEIRAVLQKRFGGMINLQQSVNSELIGGFKLRVDDLFADTSVSSKLEALRRHYTLSNKRIV